MSLYLSVRIQGSVRVMSLWDWSVEGGGPGGGAEKPALVSLPRNPRVSNPQPAGWVCPHRISSTFGFEVCPLGK